eukprot:4258338-Pyramimonas_sp.AAC.1
MLVALQVVRAIQVIRLILIELIGIFKAIPYAIRANNAHKSSGKFIETRLERARYGTELRNTVDVYSSSTLDERMCFLRSYGAHVNSSDSSARPVCLFVHGGIWATVSRTLLNQLINLCMRRILTPACSRAGSWGRGGSATHAQISTIVLRTSHRELGKRIFNIRVHLSKELSCGFIARVIALTCQKPYTRNTVWMMVGVQGEKWQYAPMARRLAEEGNVVVVMEYTLYPSASADFMVGEVDAALDWVFQNITEYGGSPDKVALMGHSAGVQPALHPVTLPLSTRLTLHV